MTRAPEFAFNPNAGQQLELDFTDEPKVPEQVDANPQVVEQPEVLQSEAPLTIFETLQQQRAEVIAMGERNGVRPERVRSLIRRQIGNRVMRAVIAHELTGDQSDELLGPVVKPVFEPEERELDWFERQLPVGDR